MFAGKFSSLVPPNLPGFDGFNSKMSPEANAYLQQGSSDVWQSFGNLFTGNKTWQREMIKQDFQNAFNASEAQKTRDWQERLSNTAYQRAADDMRKAGLNPYLAYAQGGAGTPSGATASAGSGNTNASGSGKLAQILTTAFQVAAMVGSRSALAHSLEGIDKGVEISSGVQQYLASHSSGPHSRAMHEVALFPGQSSKFAKDIRDGNLVRVGDDYFWVDKRKKPYRYSRFLGYDMDGDTGLWKRRKNL